AATNRMNGVPGMSKKCWRKSKPLKRMISATTTYSSELWNQVLHTEGAMLERDVPATPARKIAASKLTGLRKLRRSLGNHGSDGTGSGGAVSSSSESTDGVAASTLACFWMACKRAIS